ncbi:hypothetical protein U6A24_02400 [Aquimarina gracilis]|uniref:Uncharacterized protein n=1 Tax=Aquimarina gracilis TaxID=874422 RepID=A0ABU5ZQE0_9FLAO|nr:hypothetical protein [Aquimarina gracilis]MEB3344290.1 hypothetical protein [Aquimarina gracilis]
MKKYFFFFLTFIISYTYSQDLDSLKIIEIPASFADYEGEAPTVKKDSLYIFRTPDIYLINKKSFSAIREVYLSTLNQDKMTKDLIEKYTKTLSRNIDLERKLKINFKASDSLDLEIYKRTQATLSNTQRALDYTINSLEKANNSLELIEKNTKRQRRKSAFEKVLFALGGVGIGVLVGVSL